MLKSRPVPKRNNPVTRLTSTLHVMWYIIITRCSVPCLVAVVYHLCKASQLFMAKFHWIYICTKIMNVFKYPLDIVGDQVCNQVFDKFWAEELLRLVRLLVKKLLKTWWELLKQVTQAGLVFMWLSPILHAKNGRRWSCGLLCNAFVCCTLWDSHHTTFRKEFNIQCLKHSQNVIYCWQIRSIHLFFSIFGTPILFFFGTIET